MAKILRAPTDNCAKMGKFPRSYPETRDLKSPARNLRAG